MSGLVWAVLAQPRLVWANQSDPIEVGPPPLDLTGSVAAVLAVSGSLTVEGALAGWLAAAGALAGSLTVERALSGEMASSAVLSGALTVSNPTANPATQIWMG